MARGRLTKAGVGHGLLNRSSASFGKGGYVMLLLLVAVGSLLAIGAWRLGISVLPAAQEITTRVTLDVSATDEDGSSEGAGRVLCECPTLADVVEEDYTSMAPDLFITGTATGNTSLACDTLAACQTPYRKCGEQDICGKRVNCGGCAFPEMCGGGTEPDKCGCSPRSCKDFDRNCGQVPDGCGGILSCGLPCVPWILDLASNDKPPEPKRPYRIGRFSNVAQYARGPLKAMVGDVDTKHYSHIIFSHAAIDKETLDVKASQWNDADVKANYAAKGSWRLLSDASSLTATVPMLSIGGWDFISSEDGKAILSQLLSSGDAREKFVANLGKWMELYNYRGLELDWQWPEKEHFDNLLKLLGDIRAAFDKLKEKNGWSYWLSIRGPVNPGFADAIFPDKAALGKVVDWVAVMATGLHQYDKEKGMVHTGASAPIYDLPEHTSVASSIVHWKGSGLPSTKVVLEVGTAGVAWQLESPSVNKYGAPAKGSAGANGTPFVSYRELLAEFSDEKAVRDVFHAATSTVYASKGDKWVSYDDARTIAMKVDFVVQQQLGGYLLSIDQDDAKQSLSIAASDRTRPTHIEIKNDMGSVMLVSSSPATPCPTSQGTFMLTRAMKNKLDYAQRHNWTLMWSQAVLQPQKGHPFTLPSLFKKLLAAHPEVDWFLWTDSDAIFTDIFFQLPFKNFRWHDLVVDGSKKCVYEDKTEDGKVNWNCINTGVFLLRNSPWAVELVNEWFELTCPELAGESEQLVSKVVSGKPEGVASNDKSALLYLLHKDKERRGDRTYFEDSGMLTGLWEPVVEHYEDYEAKAGLGKAWTQGNAPPFVTHFAGCKICSEKASGTAGHDKCFKHMDRALNFADNQVLDFYDMKHADLATPALISVHSRE